MAYRSDLFVRQLEQLDGDTITVHILSEDGNVMEAIYNALKNSGKRIVVYNDGLSASTACAIAMAGLHQGPKKCL